MHRLLDIAGPQHAGDVRQFLTESPRSAPADWPTAAPRSQTRSSWPPPRRHVTAEPCGGTSAALELPEADRLDNLAQGSQQRQSPPSLPNTAALAAPTTASADNASAASHPHAHRHADPGAEPSVMTAGCRATRFPDRIFSRRHRPQMAVLRAAATPDAGLAKKGISVSACRSPARSRAAPRQRGRPFGQDFAKHCANVGGAFDSTASHRAPSTCWSPVRPGTSWLPSTHSRRTASVRAVVAIDLIGTFKRMRTAHPHLDQARCGGHHLCAALFHPGATRPAPSQRRPASTS